MTRSVSFAAAADVLRDTDFADACPIATVAREVALALFCMIEGAFLHCRTTRTTEAMDVAARAATATVAAALADR